jgi:MFS family permease
MALLPRVVGKSRLGPANALLHTVQDLGVVVGPPIGAVLLATAPNAVAFLANGLTFLVSAALVSRLRRRAVAGAREHESARLHFLQGLQAARATPFVVPLLTVIAMAELTYGAQTVQLVVYVVERLDLGAAGYGYLLAAGGVGGVLSALVTPRLSTGTRVAGVVVLGGALYCAGQLA